MSVPSSGRVGGAAGRAGTRKRRRHQQQQWQGFGTTTASQTPALVVRRSSALAEESATTKSTMEYARGWAWQQVLLHRRLAAATKRRRDLPEQDCEEGDCDDRDSVLLLEHGSVYTLGRGADETHFAFLQGQQFDGDAGNRVGIVGDVDDARNRLSRSNRGPDSARLAVDRVRSVRRGGDNDNGDDSSLLSLAEGDAVDALLSEIDPSPVEIDPFGSGNGSGSGVPIYRVERGGEVTYHGPGQLVVYPLVNLKRDPYKKDLHWFLRMVEQVIIETLRHYDIEGERDPINTGVWVDTDIDHCNTNSSKKKIAAVGMSASGWITTHGFALNVAPDLSYFDTSVILPCGVEGRGVTSIAEVLAQRQKSGGVRRSSSLSTGSDIPSVGEVSEVVLEKLKDVFGVRIERGASVY